MPVFHPIFFYQKLSRYQEIDAPFPNSNFVAFTCNPKNKASFDAFCSNVGLNTSTAINLFVKAVFRENRIPFEITQTADPFFSEANMAYVMKSVRELKAGKGTVHELIKVEDE